MQPIQAYIEGFLLLELQPEHRRKTSTVVYSPPKNALSLLSWQRIWSTAFLGPTVVPPRILHTACQVWSKGPTHYGCELRPTGAHNWLRRVWYNFSSQNILELLPDNSFSFISNDFIDANLNTTKSRHSWYESSFHGLGKEYDILLRWQGENNNNNHLISYVRNCLHFILRRKIWKHIAYFMNEDPKGWDQESCNIFLITKNPWLFHPGWFWQLAPC